MRKKNYALVGIIFLLSFPAYSVSANLEMNETRIFFQTGVGIAYDLDFGSDFFYNTMNRTFFDVPLFFEIDVRFLPVISLGTGISFIYNLHYYVQNEFDFYKNSLFIDIPFHVKFYPFSKIDNSYSSFYLGFGAFLRLWAVNTYAIYSKENSYIGNAYEPGTNLVLPGECYMPANVGISLFLGNVMRLTEQFGLGIDLFLKYTFIPYVNGYLTQPNARDRSGNVALGFWADVGIKFFVSVELTGKRPTAGF